MDVIDDVVSVSSAYCYVISRHSYRMMWWIGFWNCHCVTMPMHLFCHTYGISSPMLDYTPLTARLFPIRSATGWVSLVMWCTSFTHGLQNIYEIYFCSGAWNGMGRGSHHVLHASRKGRPQILSHLLRVT